MTKIDIHTVDGRIWHGTTELDFDAYSDTVISQRWVKIQDHIWLKTLNIVAVIDRSEDGAGSSLSQG